MVDKKMPLKDRLEIAIEKYILEFGEHPPVFGFEDEELYMLLTDSLKNNTKMPGPDEYTREVLGLSDDADIII